MIPDWRWRNLPVKANGQAAARVLQLGRGAAGARPIRRQRAHFRGRGDQAGGCLHRARVPGSRPGGPGADARAACRLREAGRRLCALQPARAAGLKSPRPSSLNPNHCFARSPATRLEYAIGIMSAVESGSKAGRAALRAIVVGIAASATLGRGCSEKSEPEVQPPTAPTPTVTTPGTSSVPGTTTTQAAPAAPTATAPKAPQP